MSGLKECFVKMGNLKKRYKEGCLFELKYLLLKWPPWLSGQESACSVSGAGVGRRVVFQSLGEEDPL